MTLPKFKEIEKPSIQLYGIHGTFKTPNSDYVVKYFSTFANNNQKGLGPHLLLQELKPMRERIDPSQINDLSTLLQRDLNDSRVANELVPYLLGHKGGLAFFPAILAVLMPNGFLATGDKIYPETRVEGNLTYYEYEGNELWSLESGSDNPLGILKIYSDSTDIVVLDGQHRANAFRVVTGDFFNDKNAKLYEPFYQQSNVEGLGGVQDNFEADLPVTIVWFERLSDNLVKPELISRKLFVDVNNTAKPVSESRTILLNDFEPASILTRLFYSEVASTANFQADHFSMLHGGFDVDSDLRYSNPHSFTLSTPQIIYYCMDWVFFGTRHHFSMHIYEVKRETQRIDTSQCKSYMPEFGKFIRVTGQDDNEKYFDMDKANEEMNLVVDEFNKSIGLVFQRLLNEFNFLKLHYEACNNTFKQRDSWGSMTKKEVLDKVFCGGEGLYYAYKNVPRSKLTDQIRDIKSAIDEIEKDFKLERKKLFESDGYDFESNRVDKAFESFRSKAFQVGYVMSFFHFYQYKISNNANINYDQVIDDYLKRISNINPSQWVIIFTEMREKVISGADPKKWPAYHKILLRIIEENNEFFNNETNLKYAPEIRIFKTELKEKLRKYCDLNGYLIKEITIEQLDSSLRSEWFQEIEVSISELYEKCGLKVYNLDFQEEGNRILNEILEKNVSSETVN